MEQRSQYFDVTYEKKMIEVNRYRRLARTFAFICYVLAVAVFCVGVVYTLNAATQDISNIGVEGITNARLATMAGSVFAVWTVMTVLLGWGVQRVFGQHRRTEKPVARAAVGCLRLSSLGCIFWVLLGALVIVFTGQVLTTAKAISIPEYFVGVSIATIVNTLILTVAWFIKVNFVDLNDEERNHAYQTYLNDVQGVLPQIANPEIRAFLQQQTFYVLPKLDQSLKGTLLKDLSRLNLLNGSTRIVLHNADFRHADLRSSDLPEADLQEINLEEARLGGSLLYKLNLYKARLKKSDLSRARLQEANLQEADLTEAVLTGAKLRAANLNKANLQGANLQGADLRYANLEGAVLKEADLRGADLTGAVVTTAQIRNTKV